MVLHTIVSEYDVLRTDVLEGEPEPPRAIDTALGDLLSMTRIDSEAFHKDKGFEG